MMSTCFDNDSTVRLVELELGEYVVEIEGAGSNFYVSRNFLGDRSVL